MLKYLAAAVTAVVLAAMLTYAAFTALSRECSLGDALPKAASPSAPNLSGGAAEKPGQPAAAPRAPSKAPMASFDIKISEQDRMQGTIFFESWQGSKAEWTRKFLCDVKAGDFVTAIFSVLLVVFAGLLLGAIHQLWLATRQNGRAQRSDTEIVQRAYLSAYPMGINPLDAASYAEGHVEFRNAGRLPARKVRWFIDVATSSDGRRTHFPMGQLSGNNVIHPGSEMKQWGRTAVSRQEFENFQQDHLWIYVWGTVLYDDGFGNERHTNFCHRYDARGFAFTVAGITSQQALQLGRAAVSTEGAIYHQYGNDAD